MSEENLSKVVKMARSYVKAIAEVYYRVRSTGNALDRELHSYFRLYKGCGSRDRRFISESLFSMFRWYGWINGILPQEKMPDAFSDANFKKALVMALYLDGDIEGDIALYLVSEIGLPDLSEAPVELEARKVAFEKLFSLSNLDIQDLVPAWFIDEAPEDTNWPALIASFQTRPPLWLRLQGRKGSSTLNELRNQSIDFTKHNYMKKAIEIKGKRLPLNEMKSYKGGCFEVQDLASQALGYACSANAGDTWWDVCAGGGGKTLLLADSMKGRGHIVASDIRAWKLDEVKRRAKRGGFKNLSYQALEEGVEAPFKNKFSGVLVDAPCSCTGTWRRNPDERWRSAETVCSDFATVQKDIVATGIAAVKPGGVFVYATCSFSVKENEEVVEYILANFPDLDLEGFPHPLRNEVTDGVLRIQPFEDNSDAMFAARFRKRK